MKKIIFILIMMCACLSINAQEWKTIQIDGDELMGTQSCKAFVYQQNEDSWSFIQFDYMTDDFILKAPNSVFDFTGKGASGGKLVKGIVGFYDDNGKLIEKIDTYCFESLSSYYNQVHSNKYSKMGGNNKKNAKKIIDYLHNNKGSVRFIIPLYNSTSFDFTVSCLNN